MYGGGCDVVDSVGADANACCNRMMVGVVMLHNGSVGDTLDGGALLDDGDGVDCCSRYCWDFRAE